MITKLYVTILLSAILITACTSGINNSEKNSLVKSNKDSMSFWIPQKNEKIVFDAKTVLVKHYQDTLYATHFRGTKMIIETPAANRLINQYFKS